MDELDYLGKDFKHFLAYHNAEKRGTRLYEDGFQGDFAFETRKSVQNMAGNKIWILEGYGKPKTYLFRGYYDVDVVESDENDDQLYYLVGKEGEFIEHEVVLNNEFWFPSLRRMQGNFGFGIQALRQEYVQKFEILLAEHVSFRPF